MQAMRIKRSKGIWLVCLIAIVLFIAQYLFHSYVELVQRMRLNEHVQQTSLQKTGFGLDSGDDSNIKLLSLKVNKLDNILNTEKSYDAIVSQSSTYKKLEDAENHYVNITYHGRDLMAEARPVYDSHFKNPCWWEESTLRCLPYVFVIGVKKCGTSDLFHRLGQHPEFVKPGFKEAQFFARKRFSGKNVDSITTYIEMFDIAATTIAKLSQKGKDGLLFNNISVTGEGSPSNLHLNSHWRHLPGNEGLQEPKLLIVDYIGHFIPQARIIIAFRDPIERLYSDYYHEYGTLKRVSDPGPEHFHSVVTQGLAMYRDCFKRRTVRSCVYDNTFYDQTKIQIQLGIYYIYWMDLRRVFPRDQILVLQNKNLRDKASSMKSVYRFLNMKTLNANEMQRVIDAKEGYPRKAEFVAKGPMLNETLRLLKDFYAPFNIKMAELTGDPDFLYSNNRENVR